MRKTLSFVGIALFSALVGAVTAVSVIAKSGDNDVQVIEKVVERTPALGAHFTSYEQGSYPDLTYAAENAVKAVVNIEVISEVAVPNGYNPFFDLFGIPQQQGMRKHEQRSGGSGVIITPDGYIVTNNHVVEKSTKLRVKLNDGRTFEARKIGTDPATDVALIKVEGENLQIGRAHV